MTGILTDRIEPTPGVRALGLDAYRSATGDVLSATAEETFIRNPLPTIYRFFQRWENEARTEPIQRTRAGGIRNQRYDPDSLLTAEEANAHYGIAGELSFDAPIARGSAEQLHDLKRGELQRRSVFRRAAGGLGETLAQFGVGLGVSALDPINIASAFIPAVGPARYALWAARLGQPAARLAVGAIEGAVGTAAIEPIVYAGARAEQADYSAADSLLNIAFGTALGGGLHLGAGWLHDRLTGARSAPLHETVAAAPPATREAALRGAVAAVAEGRPVRVAETVPEFDPALRQFDELVAGRGRTVAAIDDLTAPAGLMAAPEAKGFELGAIAGEGTAARYVDYSKPKPGDRAWIEGAVAEVREAKGGSRLFTYNETAPGLTVTGEKSTFPAWFQKMNQEDKVTTELVERTGRKLLEGKPLGKHEARVALELMGRARELRTENVRQMVQSRESRSRRQIDELARFDQEDQALPPEDRTAAAAIDAETRPSLAAPGPEAQAANDAAAIEAEVADLAALAGETVGETDELAAAAALGRSYEQAATCLAGVL